MRIFAEFRAVSLFLALGASIGVAQQPGAPSAGAADYTARREAALAPAMNLIRRNDYVAAWEAVQPALSAYPKDLSVLFVAADAARLAGAFPEAIGLYQRCLALKVVAPGLLHLGLVRTYADMGHWAEFNQERALVRQMALAGDATLSYENGYIIEDHHAGSLHMQVLEFPANDLATITRLRFSLVSARVGKGGFVPSVDLESNPTDDPSFARQFPQQAAAHVRPFALASYPDSHSRAFLKFYSNGEPAYEDARADALTYAARTTAPKAIGQPETFRPAYHAPPR